MHQKRSLALKNCRTRSFKWRTVLIKKTWYQFFFLYLTCYWCSFVFKNQLVRIVIWHLKTTGRSASNLLCRTCVHFIFNQLSDIFSQAHLKQIGNLFSLIVYSLMFYFKQQLYRSNLKTSRLNKTEAKTTVFKAVF